MARQRDGKEFKAELSVTALRRRERAFVFIGFFRDLTEQRAAEDSCGRRRRWRRSASSPAASRTTSTTC